MSRIIKFSSEIGKKGRYKYIWSACEVCGTERWVRLINGKPRDTRCKKCVARINGTQRGCPVPKDKRDTAYAIPFCLNCLKERCVDEKKKKKKE